MTKMDAIAYLFTAVISTISMIVSAITNVGIEYPIIFAVVAILSAALFGYAASKTWGGKK